jgi:hypothetical protein
VGYIARIDLLSGTTITGSFEFERLGIDNSGAIEVNGTDEMIIGSSIGSRLVQGDGEFTVSGASAVMTFSSINISIDGPVTVADGLMEFTDLPLATLFNTTLDIDGGDLSVEGDLMCSGVVATISDGGGMVVDEDLTVQLSGWPASSLTLASGSGDVDVIGNVLFNTSTVTIAGGSLATVNLDMFNSALTVSGGDLLLVGDLTADITTGNSSITLSSGGIEVDLLDAAFTDITVSGGLLDAGSVGFPLGNDVLVSDGTFAVAGAFTAESTSFDNAITVVGGELELNGGYSGTQADFAVTGGMLDINDDLSNEGAFAFLGGTITLAVNQLAAFVPNP